MREMAEAKRATTADELLGMPDDGFRYELVRGELRRMSPAGYRHGLVAANLLRALSQLGAVKPHPERTMETPPRGQNRVVNLRLLW